MIYCDVGWCVVVARVLVCVCMCCGCVICLCALFVNALNGAVWFACLHYCLCLCAIGD